MSPSGDCKILSIPYSFVKPYRSFVSLPPPRSSSRAARVNARWFESTPARRVIFQSHLWSQRRPQRPRHALRRRDIRLLRVNALHSRLISLFLRVTSENIAMRRQSPVVDRNLLSSRLRLACSRSASRARTLMMIKGRPNSSNASDIAGAGEGSARRVMTHVRWSRRRCAFSGVFWLAQARDRGEARVGW